VSIVHAQWVDRLSQVSTEDDHPGARAERPPPDGVPARDDFSHERNTLMITGRTFTLVSVALVALTAFTCSSSLTGPAQAQDAARPAGRAPIQGLSRQPSEAASEALLDPSDTAILLLDHQTGLFQTVKDVPIAELRANTVALAKIGELAKVPIFTTASEPKGPNGPLMSELAAAAPSATYVPRKGEISAWDNADFVAAVEASGRKTLVIAGVWTSVCVAFPALQAKADGYKVYYVTDASGDPSEMAFHTTLGRMSQAGVIPVTTNVVLCELQRTWNRPDAAQWGALYSELVPNYRAVAESYQKAQAAAQGK
jgi:nicotinamidase-related amidase